MYQISRWNPEDEQWVILREFDTYDEADEVYDEYADLYPYTWVEILDTNAK